MKTLEHIASELAGYDPQALSADMVHQFLTNLVEPVTQTEEVAIFDALGRVLARHHQSHQRATARQLSHGRLRL